MISDRPCIAPAAAQGRLNVANLGASLSGLLPGLFAAATGASLEQPRPYGYALAIGMLIYAPVIWVLSTMPERCAETPAAMQPVVARGAAPYAVLGAVALVTLLRVGGEFVVRTFHSVYMDRVWLVPTAQIGAAIALANLLTIPAPLVAPSACRADSA